MSRFAQTDDEAQRRFELYKSRDAFPHIAPALLNSADISDYVAATGMIYPFVEGGLKPASYEAALEGTVIFWDEKDRQHRIELTRGMSFTLFKNSIAFVTLQPKLRLPDYIALRFNLRITNVHRGLLLGTGPLVDPGFEGKLIIPLHNLTTNDYTFMSGENLIWIEFTKLSENQRWAESPEDPARTGQYVPFPANKKNLTVDYYLSQASPHRSIRSSIADAVQGARLDANKAARSAQTTKNIVAGVGFLSLIALSFGFYQILSLVEDSHQYVSDAKQHLSDTKQRLIELQNNVAQQQQQINKLAIDLTNFEHAQMDAERRRIQKGKK